MNMHQHQEWISIGFGVSEFLEYHSSWIGQIVSQKQNFLIQAIMMGFFFGLYTY